MTGKYQEEIKQGLGRILEEGKLAGKRVVIFGSNGPAEQMASFLECWDKSSGINSAHVECFVDNNKKKQGTQVMGRPIYSPQGYLTPFDGDIRILIASKYYSEMCIELESYGYRQGEHIFEVVHIETEGRNSLLMETFQENIKKAEEGFKLLKRIKEKTGGAYVFLCPYAALGDVYLAGGYLESYCQKENINSYVVVVITEACVEVLGMFGITCVEKVTKDGMEALVKACIFMGLKECGAGILHQRFPYPVALGRAGNYKGIDFNGLFAAGVFGLEKKNFQMPVKGKHIKEVENVFQQMGLRKGRTVLLAPYANTATGLPSGFWEGRAREYLDKGYSVVTNSSGEKEPAIEGTEKVFIPAGWMLDFAEYAGCFEGLRSGLCDLVSSACAEKTVYYPGRVYQDGQFYDFYGLRNMWSSMDIKEVVV